MRNSLLRRRFSRQSLLHFPERCVRQRYPAEEVTTIDAESEADAAIGGLPQEAVEAIWTAATQLYATGVYPALSLCMRRRGAIVLNRSIGHVVGNGPTDPPGRPLTLAKPSTPFCIFSASKAVTAMLIHMLDDRGLVHLDDAIREYIPEFGRGRTARTTIRHVLTHRAGIPTIPSERVDMDLLHDWDAVVKLLCEAEPISVPGRRLAYHAITGGFILGEIIRRVTGRDARQFLADEVLDPLGFTGMNYGIAPDRLEEVAWSNPTGPPVPSLVAPLVERALGAPFDEAAELANDPRFLTSIIPSGNIVANAEEACRFFELLRNEGELDGVRVFNPRTVRRARLESSYLELDFTLLLPVRYGLGFMLGSDRFALYGPATGQAFGHLGFMNTLIWADPEREISVALLVSGKPFLGPHLVALGNLMGTIARRTLA